MKEAILLISNIIIYNLVLYNNKSGMIHDEKNYLQNALHYCKRYIIIILTGHKPHPHSNKLRGTTCFKKAFFNVKNGRDGSTKINK